MWAEKRIAAEEKTINSIDQFSFNRCNNLKFIVIVPITVRNNTIIIIITYFADLLLLLNQDYVYLLVPYVSRSRLRPANLINSSSLNVFAESISCGRIPLQCLATSKLAWLQRVDIGQCWMLNVWKRAYEIIYYILIHWTVSLILSRR